MTTISTHVRNWLGSHPFVNEHLAQGLINHSALARHIKPDIEALVGEIVSVEAVTIALNRIGKSTAQSVDYSQFIGDVSVQTGLTVLCLADEQAADIIDQRPTPESGDDYFLLTKGVWHTAIVTKTATVDSLKIDDNHVLYRADNLVGLTIKLNEGHIPVPGVGAYILQVLAARGVNLDEIASTHDEMTIVVEPEHAQTALNTLMNLKSS